jgi:hypothetical protein
MTSSPTNNSNTLGRRIAYWLSTVLIAFVMGSGGVADVLRIQPVVEGMKQLGYPEYFCVILGIWKILGCVAILLPRTPILKEWAYAGIVFDLTGAAASHFAVGDPPIKSVAPLIFTILAFVSWMTRPGHRRITNVAVANAP